MMSADRRSEPRLEDSELAVLTWEENGTTLQQIGNVDNLSLNGAGIVADYPLPLSTPISLTYGEGELTAVVRHCKPLDEGHFIGVEFTGDSRGFNIELPTRE
jgi:hypothetical protein